MKYSPNCQDSRETMLKDIGVDNVDALFESIPENIRLKELLQISPPVSEFKLKKQLQQLSNYVETDAISFLGAGAYRRYIPEAISSITSRSEFLTSYTPYQPELSQGSLHMMFEFQTMLSYYTGMDVANASMYEGATAVAEAVFMAKRIKKKLNRVLVSTGLHPEYLQVLRTYLKHSSLEIALVPVDEKGQTDLDELEKMIDDSTLCSVFPVINFYGVIEDQKRHGEILDKVNAINISVIIEMTALGMIAPPGEFGADIVVGEAQSLGLPVAYGGPYLGIFACREKYTRQMPGRLIGQTVDSNGKRAFCLTLSTREQHIRREKATSNICSNQALCALWVSLYLSLIGKMGLKKLSKLNYSKTQYLLSKIKDLQHFNLRYESPVYNEFVLDSDIELEKVLATLESKNILAGVPLRRFDSKDVNGLLVNVTEVNSKEEIDCLVQSLGEVK
ncbi:MAG: aminomethyl-transferring glycine dehydrogenase subunit GcvPA [Deltaproteobacteria bacterium]|jgi:glycine dehydrogenase subunit 1|nr:aminomethyl-transferring glycine dehydrogenase subunit GcvPA [Deltaproteobacteria bacterium]